METAEEVLKSKLTIEAIRLNNSDYTFNKVIEAMELYAEKYHEHKVKNLNIPCVTNCNFKTVIALYEDADSILAVSEQILPMHKGDKITIKDKYYMVEYVDYDFDKAIFEIVVTDDN